MNRFTWISSRHVRAVSLAATLALAASARADIINGLQAKYDFNSAAAIGADTSGNSNNGTLSAVNAAFANDATRGGVLKLTGAQSNPGYVLVPDSTSLSITGDITISAFINVTSYNTFNSIVGKTAGNQPASYDYYLVSPTGVPRLYRGNGATPGPADAASPVPVNEWHMVTMTQSGTTVTAYLDGVANGGGTITAPLADTDAPLYIGSRQDLFTALNGSIDAVRIYNRALTAADVTELYLANTPEPGTLALVGLPLSATLLRRARRA